MTIENAKSEIRSPGKINPALVLQSVAEALQGLKFGHINITVHDGSVVQIERVERTRLQSRGE